MTIREQVEACRKGEHPRLVARLPSGWAVMGESQLLAGYCLLLADPVAGSLNDLDEAARRQFLHDMALLGDAVLAETEPEPARINYEMLGNVDPTLHAHVLPRSEAEDPSMQKRPVWLYPPQVWNDPANAFDPRRHGNLARAIERRVLKAARPQKSALSPLWQEAASFAARAHRGGLRQDGETPYIAHPARVALTLRDLFGCEDDHALAAALLHDVIEDTGTDFDDIEDLFGIETARLVAALSKDPRLPEAEREPAYDEALARAGWKAHLVKLADQYDNLSDVDPSARKKVRRAVERARRAVAIAAAGATRRPEIERAVALLERLIEVREKQAAEE